MPMDRNRYPSDWETIARRTKQRANWHCELCHQPRLMTAESFTDFLIRCHFTVGEAIAMMSDRRGRVDGKKEKRFELTAAHPNHDPENPDAEIKAWCNACHARYDLRQIPRKQSLNRERHGQIRLL